MADDKDKKYYWLRLKRDFFKRHDIQIIEGMPNGKDYVLFYLKLLVESVDHSGELRFSDTIPYNEQMLATITNTNIDVVRTAMKLFVEELKIIEILSDQTIYMAEIEKMIGSETYWAEKKRIYRENQPQLGQCPPNVLDVSEACPTCPSKSLEIEKDINIDIKESRAKSKRFVPPALEEVKLYCKEQNNKVDAERFINHYIANGWVQGKGKPIKDWKACVRTWESNDKQTQQAGVQSKPTTNKQLLYPQREYSPQDYVDLERKLLNKGL